MNTRGSPQAESLGIVISSILPILLFLCSPVVLISQTDGRQKKPSDENETLTICGYQTAPDGRIEDVRLEDLKRTIE